VGHVKIDVTHFYPEKFRRKIDAEKYSAKGTCEVSLELDTVEIEVKNITYRIDHEGKVMLKPPFRIHSNKKAGIKPKLVPGGRSPPDRKRTLMTKKANLFHYFLET